MEAEAEVMCPEAKERWLTPEAGGGKERILPQSLWRVRHSVDMLILLC